MAARNAKSAKMAKRRSKKELVVAAEVLVAAIEMGRPAEYKPEYCTLVKRAAMLGGTNETLAAFFDVGYTTFTRWAADHPEFREALREGRQFADANVANALYHKAVGYEHDAVKIFAAKQRTVTGDGDSKEVFEESVPLIVPYKERFAPDTEAAKYWLSRRRPDLWGAAIAGEGGGTTIIDNSVTHNQSLTVTKSQAADSYLKLIEGK